MHLVERGGPKEGEAGRKDKAGFLARRIRSRQKKEVIPRGKAKASREGLLGNARYTRPVLSFLRDIQVGELKELCSGRESLFSLSFLFPLTALPFYHSLGAHTSR